MRTAINDLKFNENTQIKGSIEYIRDSKYMCFIVLKDLSGKVQITIEKEKNPAILDSLVGLTPYSYISVFGQLVENSYVKLGGKEFIPTKIVVDSIAEAMPIGKESSIDQRLDYRWIDLRSEEKTLIFQVQTALTNYMREYLVQKNFIEIHSPKIISEPSESGAELFEVQYFEQKAYLAQSPQFYKQMAIASGFEKVFEVGPVFRAEKSHTAKHTTEFTGFDLEMAYVESEEDVMKIEEELLAYAIERVKAKYGEKIEQLLGVKVNVPTLPFPRITMNEVYKILRDRGVEIKDGEDINTDGEKVLGDYMLEKNGHEFYFVTGYPAEVRAFYHMRDEKNNKLAKGYDLYWKGLEITTGAQREHRYDVLTKQALEKGLSQEKIQFYLDFFKYGCPSHGGFGMGLDRITMILLGIPTIKEAMFIFRGPTRIKP